MATLTYLGNTITGDRAIKGRDFVRIESADGCPIFSASGITDFSDYSLTDGEWEAPIVSVAPNITAIGATIDGDTVSLTIPEALTIGTGTQINFTAPACSGDMRRIMIHSVIYTLVDANDIAIKETNCWTTGATLSVLLDAVNYRAYVLAASGSAGAINIGDIKMSARTDLSDSWLYCNGDAVDAAEYPDLHSVLKYCNSPHSVYPIADYATVKPLYHDGLWLLRKKRGQYNHSVLIYDALANTYREVVCPNHSATDTSWGIVDIIRTNNQWLMCIGSTNTSGEYTKGKAYFLKSSDLVTWSSYSTANLTSGEEVYDVVFDGTYALFLVSYGASDGTSYNCKSYRASVDGSVSVTAFTSVTKGCKERYSTTLRVYRGGYWSFQDDTDSGVTIRKNGAIATAVSSSYYSSNGYCTLFTFFNDNIWLRTPTANNRVQTLYGVDMASLSESQSLTIASIFGAVTAAWLHSMYYDKNTDEWHMYCTVDTGTEQVPYVAKVLASVSPFDASNYTVEPVDALMPTPLCQSAPNHATMFASEDTYALYDATIKRLPELADESYSYVYAGGDE